MIVVRQRHNSAAVCLGQGCCHVTGALMCAWVAPVRGHIAQRDQHECAILQAGVRQDQFTWGNAPLIRGWQRMPVGLRLDIGQHQVAKGQKIQV